MVLGVLLALLLTEVLLAPSAPELTKQAFQAQQDSLKQQPSVELGPADLPQAQRVNLQKVLQISGALKSVNAAVVKTRATCELQGLIVREGEFVKAGQVLGRVETTEYLARLRRAQQQAELATGKVENAQLSLESNKSLLAQGFISRTALDTSHNNLTSAQANYKAAQASGDAMVKALDDTVLRAPIGGQVAQRLVLAFRMFNSAVSMFSVIGVVILTGLVSKSAILLVDFAIHAREGSLDDSGQPFADMARDEALLIAARVRLRHILTTTLAMIFGTVPLAFAISDGSEQRAPMGQTVIGGVIKSSLLVVMPEVYCHMDDLAQWARRLLTSSKPLVN